MEDLVPSNYLYAVWIHLDESTPERWFLKVGITSNLMQRLTSYGSDRGFIATLRVGSHVRTHEKALLLILQESFGEPVIGKETFGIPYDQVEAVGDCLRCLFALMPLALMKERIWPERG